MLAAQERAKQQEYSRGVAKAQSLATALRTISKFTITKQAGEGGKIFGRHAACWRAGACFRSVPAQLMAVHWCSVTPQDVVDAIEKQTGQKLDKGSLQLPELKTIGTHQAAIQLHPDVIGRFSIVIAKAKQAAK